MKIYKYPLQLVPQQELTVLPRFTPLAVQIQANTLCLWAEVDTDQDDSRTVQIYIVGTGHDLPEDLGLKYIGTVQMTAFVWHVYWSR